MKSRGSGEDEKRQARERLRLECTVCVYRVYRLGTLFNLVPKHSRLPRPSQGNTPLAEPAPLQHWRQRLTFRATHVRARSEQFVKLCCD